MERLTLERLNRHINECKRRIDNISKLVNTVSDANKEACHRNLVTLVNTVNAIEEYIKIKDLEEQGLLLRLPCKIGDTVYAVTRDFISEYTICSIEAYNEGFFFCWRCEKGIYINTRGFTNYQIGIDVFLTKAEAEQKLKEMEGGNNV